MLPAAFLLTLTLTFLLYAKASNDGLQPGWVPFLLLMLLIASSQFAIAIINWITTILVAPLQLPRMDYSTGIPNDCQTMVVVPAMLVNARQVEQLIDDLEVRYLANSDPRLFLPCSPITGILKRQQHQTTRIWSISH